MYYQEFPEIEELYVVVHHSGVGVMEDPIRYVGPVYSTNNLQEAQDKSASLYREYNSKEAIEANWASESFQVYTNLSHVDGKHAGACFDKGFKEAWDAIIEAGTHELVEFGGHRWLVQKEEQHAEEKKGLESYRFDILDFSTN